MDTDLLCRIRIELGRMETRLQSGKYNGMEQEYQDMYCLLNTRHQLECGMSFSEWLACDGREAVNGRHN